MVNMLTEMSKTTPCTGCHSKGLKFSKTNVIYVVVMLRMGNPLDNMRCCGNYDNVGHDIGKQLQIKLVRCVSLSYETKIHASSDPHVRTE